MTEENYLEVLTNKINSFCHQLVSSGFRRTRALAGLLFSLSSNTAANSVVGLSLSPFFQHQYASVFDAIKHFASNDEEWRRAAAKIRRICFSTYLSETNRQADDRLVTTIDTTPRPAMFSETLPCRQSIVMPNPDPHQAYRLEVGYNLSFLNVSHFEDKWSLPLSVERVGIEETSTQCALRQLDGLLTDPVIGLKDTLVVNTVDNGYASLPFLCPLYERHGNLVNIARLKRGSKTYTPVAAPSDGSYHRKYYGEHHYNILTSDVKSYKKDGSDERYEVARRSISELKADETVIYERKMGRAQRTVLVKIERFNDRLLKSYGGYLMKDKPLDILRIQYTDEQSGNPIYKNEMYLVISGKRRCEVTTKEAQEYYVSRSDIEAFFRTSKRNLLLDKFQPGKIQHLDNHLLIVQLASWMTYLTASQAEQCLNPWERYLPDKNTKESERLTMSRSIRAAAGYYATLDLRWLKPPKSTGGTGRKKGARQTPRKRHARVRKRPVKG